MVISLFLLQNFCFGWASWENFVFNHLVKADHRIGINRCRVGSRSILWLKTGNNRSYYQWGEIHGLCLTFLTILSGAHDIKRWSWTYLLWAQRRDLGSVFNHLKMFIYTLRFVIQFPDDFLCTITKENAKTHDAKH